MDFYLSCFFFLRELIGDSLSLVLKQCLPLSTQMVLKRIFNSLSRINAHNM